MFLMLRTLLMSTQMFDPRSGRRYRHGRIPKYSDSVLHVQHRSVISGNPLDRRHGRSCDLQAANDEDKPDRYDNPIAQVSSDILRVSGYTQQFRSLLTARFSPRRESVPNVHLETENEEKGGSIRSSTS
ncbi:hypothetical protein Y032_0140g2169 [Ancylostoma ceylanicum]|uniref:Uncharacterized protein n=2 Tax=Ancylostoma ceylanicum TaxID=53326 RepID=A0A016T440_9BILA|nr:hypothetical protein Y032_0140g2169 [Ancylostoma ceylanicum]